MEGQAVSDSDRLPWLEPYREPGGEARAPPSSKATRRVPLWPLGLAGAAALVFGGYWIGRQDATQAPRSSVTAPLPPLAYPPVEALADPPPPPLPRPVSQLKRRPAVERTGSSPARRHLSSTSRKSPSAHHAARPRHKAKTVPKPPPRPRFVLRMSPPPVAGKTGQVIELGRFVTPRQADASWNRAVWRYPYLGRLTKVVAPERQGAGRPPVYALRLGAGSRRHARILCRNLIKIGYPCTVV